MRTEMLGFIEESKRVINFLFQTVYKQRSPLSITPVSHRYRAWAADKAFFSGVQNLNSCRINICGNTNRLDEKNFLFSVRILFFCSGRSFAVASTAQGHQKIAGNLAANSSEPD
jgi:hypothetical protein